MLLFLLTGCQQPAVTPTALPAPTATNPPQKSDLQLSFPASVGPNEGFGLSVTNNGSSAYAFYIQMQDNCLGISDGQGRFVPTILGDTCDALEEHIVRPGQTRFVGGWDLLVCADDDCLTRAPAAPGEYQFDLIFYGVGLDGDTDADVRFSFSETFYLRES